jgi:hypothetical protein
MTHHGQFVPDEERAHSVGATGGLPGANADPRTTRVADDELASTVSRGDVDDQLLEAEREADRVDPSDPDVSGHLGDGYLEGASDNADHADPMIDGRLADGSPAPGPRASDVDGGLDGPAAGASDNAAENASPDVAGDILGQGATQGTDADDVVSSLDPGDQSAHGGDLSGGALTNAGLPDDTDLSQPRTGAQTPVDPEDLVHASGQDATPATLQTAQERLEREGPAAVESVVPGLSERTTNVPD